MWTMLCLMVHHYDFRSFLSTCVVLCSRLRCWYEDCYAFLKDVHGTFECTLKYMRYWHFFSPFYFAPGERSEIEEQSMTRSNMLSTMRSCLWLWLSRHTAAVQVHSMQSYLREFESVVKFTISRLLFSVCIFGTYFHSIFKSFYDMERS